MLEFGGSGLYLSPDFSDVRFPASSEKVNQAGWCRGDTSREHQERNRAKEEMVDRKRERCKESIKISNQIKEGRGDKTRLKNT
jgi:hypothetical protein